DELSKLREQKLYQKLRILETEQLPVANFDGKEVINLSSNNYLGLTTHPKLKEAAARAVEEFGVGSGAVRTIAGTMTLHLELEEKIAKFKQVEASVVFQSGFAANAGTVQAILGKEDVIISDELNHASIIEGWRLIGALGGYVCSTRDAIDFLCHRARPFLFSTSHPPSVAATSIAAFEVLEQEPQLIEELWANTKFFKEGLKKLGFNTGLSETPITP